MKTIMYLVMLMASAVLHFVNGNTETIQKEERLEWTECTEPVNIPRGELTKVKDTWHCS